MTENSTGRVSTDKPATGSPAGEYWTDPNETPFAAGVHAGPWGDPTPPPAATPAPKTDWRARITLRRSRSDRMLSGVCGGLAEAFDVDANLIRIGLVLLTVFGVGAGAVAYLAAWVLVPEQD